jgi:hypothetical protein
LRDIAPAVLRVPVPAERRVPVAAGQIVARLLDEIFFVDLAVQGGRVLDIFQG